MTELSPYAPSIPPAELRLGNIINYKGQPVRVTMTILNNIIHMDHDYRAIELTPEWLEKCDLSQLSQSLDIGKNAIRDGSGMYDGYLILIGSTGERKKRHSMVIHFLHQLQNLYHSLTGTELKVNL